MRTKITASAPSAIRTSRSGTAAGSTIPASRDDSRISVASPMKKTSLPSVPVCQPVTENVRPLGSVPTYQSVNAEIARTSPEIHASRVPQLSACGVVRSGRGGRCSGWVRNGRAGSGVCTAQVWAKWRSGVRQAPDPRDEEAVQQVGVQVEESADVPVRASETLLDDPGFADFVVAGTRASGEFRCADCGYGAVVQRLLPQCPMCGGTVGESRGPLRSRLLD